ncbi:MAG TPA: hypothetical protein VH814_12790 [Steroidobacteraceae bacterium]|jgi:hypothetical protein
MKLDPSAVATREQLARFVEILRADLVENAEHWENATLERFLGALSSYIEDVPGYLQNTNSSLRAEVPTWQLFAILLCGARVYE